MIGIPLNNAAGSPLNINLTDIGRELRVQDPVPLGSKIPTWKVGQVLNAVAAGRDPSGRLQMQIGGQRLSATTARELDVEPGARLLLEVVKAGAQPVLRLLAEPNADKAVDAALRQLFPRQQPLTDLAANLAHLRANPKQLEQFPAPIRQALTRLIDGFPQAARLARPGGLRDALANSGLFLESRLQQPGNGAQIMQSDTKGLLARLVQTLSQSVENSTDHNQTPTRSGTTTPPGRLQPQGPAQATLEALGSKESPLRELFNQASGALARIEIHQTQAAQQPNGLWLPLEVPVWDGDTLDVLQLQVGRDGGGAENDDEEQPMLVRIAFEFRSLGPVYANVRLSGNRVSTTWWAERPEIAGLFRENLEWLRGRLTEAGLDVGTINCSQGAPAAEPRANGPGTIPRGILDEEA